MTAKTGGPEIRCQLRKEFAGNNAVVVAADVVVADVVTYQSEFRIVPIKISIIVVHIVIILSSLLFLFLTRYMDHGIGWCSHCHCCYHFI